MTVRALEDESEALQSELQDAVAAGDAQRFYAVMRQKQTLVVESQRRRGEMKAELARQTEELARRPEAVGPPATIADLRAIPALRAEIVAHLRRREAAWAAFAADGGTNAKPQ